MTDTLPPLDEREAFEAWLQREYPLSWARMTAHETGLMWDSWQARAALPAAQPIEQPESVYLAQVSGCASTAPLSWVPVTPETMPPAGRPVLASVLNNRGKRHTIRAHYAPKHTVDASHWDDGETDDTEDGCYEPEGWWEDPWVGERLEFVSASEGEVTHWADLPHPGENADTERARSNDPESVAAPQRDNCELCHGTRGGVPGNENRVDGKVICDYCHAAPVAHPTKPTTFRAILDWRMCSDPWPGGDMQAVDEWLDAQSRDLGYSDWLDAYHTLQSLPAVPVAAQPDTSGVAPCTRISEDDLTELERMVSQPSRPACFFPVDADQLANAVLLMIREVRAARGVKEDQRG
jgi:hypothetical protein